MPPPIFLALGLGGLAALLLAGSSKKASAGGTPPPAPGGGVGTLPGCPPTTPNAGIAMMPEPYRSHVQAAVLSPASSPEALDAMAAQLVTCGQSIAAGEVSARAAELRKVKAPGVFPGSPGGSGGLTAVGVAPVGVHYQSASGVPWRHLTATGEGPAAITMKYFGDGNAKIPGSESGEFPSGKRRFIELIEANPGRPTVGDKYNVFSETVTATNPEGKRFNFKYLGTGDQLSLPDSWRGWVSEEGYRRGEVTPFSCRPGSTGCVV